MNESEKAPPKSPSVRSPAEERVTTTPDELSPSERALQKPTHFESVSDVDKFKELQRDLECARNRELQALGKLKLVEGETAELSAELAAIKGSLAWRIAGRVRVLKNRALPPGTRRRKLYDRCITPFKNRSVSSSPATATADRKVGSPNDFGDAFYRSDLEIRNPVKMLLSGTLSVVTVTVKNMGTSRWLSKTTEPYWRGSVRLSYHWYDDLGNAIQWEGERTNLPEDLEPTASATVEMRVFAPFRAGNYALKIALVHEGVAWFDQKGECGSEVQVSVESSLPNQQFPSCSIIIPTFNRAEFTRYCLSAIDKSVKFESVPHEIIVVDNGSNDGTPEMLGSWSGSRATKRAILMQGNLGFARACNLGAGLARGDFVIFLNNDTLPTPGWLEQMLKLAKSESNVGIIGSKLLFPNDRIQHVGIVFDENKAPKHIYRGFRSNIPPAKTSREFQAVTGACLMVSKELFWSLGGMDEQYENSYEDIDLCMKARMRGYRVILCADSVLYHFECMTQGRQVNELRNRALFKTRWERSISSDAQDWYEQDGFIDQAIDFEASQGYQQRHEALLADLWKRIYSGSLPDRGFSFKSVDAHTLGHPKQ